jgi:glycosyltransferase involved in cell wall biosynthesis
MPAPRISVLLISYKHEQFIAEALRSLLAQTATHFEIIIADDASPDRTREVIEAILKDNQRSDLTIIKVYHEKNLGLLGNVNAAMAAASGEIFVMAAGDDIALPNRISQLLAGFDASPEIQLVCSNYQKITEDGQLLGTPPSRFRTRIFNYHPSERDIYAHSPICGATAAYRRTLYENFGPMCPGTHGEDNCFWVRALLIGKIYYNSAPLIHWRQHRDNLSNSIDDSFTTPESRNGLIKWMRAHSQMLPQWERDIQTALDKGLISPIKAQQTLSRGKYDAAKWEMQYCTLGVRPWSEWFLAAKKLLPYLQFDRILRFFKLRISDRRRQREWQWWANYRRKN